MVEELEQRLNDYAEAAEMELARLREQISKIIEIKKKTTGDKSEAVMLSQVKDALKTADNLEKISAKLPEAIDDIKKICQQARVLLKEVSLHRGGPTSTQEHR
jgi:hypothetical protein